MIEIVPAILPKDFEELREKLESVLGLVDSVQIDVLDGGLTPKASWPYTNTEEDNFKKIVTEEESLPFWEDFKFEVDCMVRNPHDHVSTWITAGAERIVVHAESFESPEDLEEFVAYFNAHFVSPGSLISVYLGIALGVDTSPLFVERVLGDISFVQCMGIERIGFQGEAFDSRVLQSIKAVKNMHPHITVSVDGGVTLDTAPQLLDAGATRLVIGSAIFGSDNIPDTIESFYNL